MSSATEPVGQPPAEEPDIHTTAGKLADLYRRNHEAVHAGSARAVAKQHEKGKKTSTNPIASIYAWTRGLAHRGRLDKTPEVVRFAETLERVCVEAVEGGQMTKDLATLIHGDKTTDRHWLTTEDFLAALDTRLAEALAGPAAKAKPKPTAR